jgi:hypothetical protein
MDAVRERIAIRVGHNTFIEAESYGRIGDAAVVRVSGWPGWRIAHVPTSMHLGAQFDDPENALAALAEIDQVIDWDSAIKVMMEGRLPNCAATVDSICRTFGASNVPAEPRVTPRIAAQLRERMGWGD